MSNLSAGVQILVDQLKENPDHFFGSLSQDKSHVPYYPKFHGWRQVIEEELVGIDYRSDKISKRLPNTWFMTEEEKEALADAYLLAKRQRFDAEVITALTAESVEEGTVKFNAQNRYVFPQGTVVGSQEAMRLDSSGNLGIGSNSAAGVYRGRV